MPAYRAALTLELTYREIPFDIVDDVILVDDASPDNTVDVARQLGIQHVIRHDKNKGYGGNQKTCYKKAVELGGDIVVMLHPDYQYTPLLLTAMISIIGNGLYPVVFASRPVSHLANREETSSQGRLDAALPYRKNRDPDNLVETKLCRTVSFVLSALEE